MLLLYSHLLLKTSQSSSHSRCKFWKWFFTTTIHFYVNWTITVYYIYYIYGTTVQLLSESVNLINILSFYNMIWYARYVRFINDEKKRGKKSLSLQILLHHKVYQVVFPLSSLLFIFKKYFYSVFQICTYSFF